MTEIRHKNAIVRIHGTVDREQVEKATIKLMKEVIKCRKQREKENANQ